MKKKLIALLLAIVTIVSVGAMTTVSANAASTILDSKSFWLYSSDKGDKYSAEITAKQTKAKGENAETSSHWANMTIQYKSGTVWVNSGYYQLKKGETKTIGSIDGFSANFQWRLKLRSNGIVPNGCTTKGTIYSMSSKDW